MSRTRSKLQLKIDKKAIELYAAVEKQFEVRRRTTRPQSQALKRDKAKVEEERDAVVRLIEEIDTEKRRLLDSSFLKVDSLFNEIFSTLLPGSTAHLVPIDQIVAKGIEMKVSLSGTTKHRLGELSGGQKSLLALSLILAMLKLNVSSHVSPFRSHVHFIFWTKSTLRWI